MDPVTRLFGAVTDRVIEQPRRVVIACLVVTALFAPGMALLEASAAATSSPTASRSPTRSTA